MAKKIEPYEIEPFLDRMLSLVQQGDEESNAQVWKELLTCAEAARKPAYHQLLRVLYADVPKLDHPHEYACAVFPAEPHQKADINSILAPDIVEPPEAHLVQEQKYATLMSCLPNKKGERAFDGKAFSMTRIETNPLRITCHRSSYFKFLATCQSLKIELQKAWNETAISTVKITDALTFLKQRNELHRLVQDPVTDGSHRAACIGVSTLICCRVGAEYQFLLRQRSTEKHASGQESFQVLPSGLFERSEKSKKDEAFSYSVYETVLREYSEELFSHGEPAWKTSERYYRDTEEVRHLDHLITCKSAHAYVTGIAMDLSILQPEICVLLLIHDPRWAKEWIPRMKLNIEYKNQKPGESGGLMIPLENDEILVKKYPQLAPTNMVIDSAGAFWLGIDVAKEEIERYEKRKNSGSSDARTRSEVLARDANKTVYITRLANGQVDRSKPTLKDDIERLLEEDKSDIVVDEVFQHKVRVMSKDPAAEHISELSEICSVMLWLVLTNIGGYVQHSTIRKLFGWKPPKQVNYFRRELARWLGLKADAVIPKVKKGARAKKWRVPLEGWSCCWVLDDPDANKSELIRDILKEQMVTSKTERI
ncbi:MAG: hypothetical protein IH984_06950 [Planctomycetes bacterium]|nr:hypothetical protein [Planctomycetota bacterium]